MPGDKILFPRRMLYVEAVLYLVIALASFGLGYLFGRGGSQASTNTAASPVEKRVPVEGQIRAGREGDSGAVIILLPTNKPPDAKLPAAGFRPGNPPGGTESAAMQALASLGGVCGRADAEGHFTLFAPEPGNYRILIISRNSQRGAIEPRDADEIEVIGKYFQSPDDLLARSHYHLLSLNVNAGMSKIRQDFPE